MTAELPPATFTTYEALIAQMRARRIALGLSQLAVDEIAGLPSGYVGKVEASLTNPTAKNARSIGRESLPLMLGALGLELAAHQSAALRGKKHNGANAMPARKIKTLSDRGRRGGQIWWARLTEKQRRARIVKMNRARAAKLAAKRTKQAKEKA